MSEAMRTDWWRRATGPLARMLVLSLSLHLAVVMLIQPAPGSAVPRIVVIQARLSEPPRPQTEPEPQPPMPDETVVAEAPPAPVPESVPKPEPPRTPPMPYPTPTPVPTPAPAPPEQISPLPPVMPAQTQKPAVTAVAPPAPPSLPSPVAMPTEAPHAASRSAEGSTTSLPQVPVPFDTRWYAAREVDVLPKPTQSIRYDYPESARKAGLEGSVLVLLHVDEQGKVREVEVLESVPPGVFDELVLDTLHRVVFTPARLNGTPVRALVKHRVRFELE